MIVGGTLGYRWLWRDVGGTWLDAQFMTVTTITTIGYGEVRPLSGAGRIFTMAVAFVGIGSLSYTFGVCALQTGDRLLALGTIEQLARLERLVASGQGS